MSKDEICERCNHDKKLHYSDEEKKELGFDGCWANEDSCICTGFKPTKNRGEG